MDSSGGQNQILICKRQREGGRAGGKGVGGGSVGGGVGGEGGSERAQEVPGNAHLWVNPPHLIVLLFVCDIDSSGGD